MDESIVYERDLLYPTDGAFDPGSIHVELHSPKKKGIPVVIEGKTPHSPLKYIKCIIQVLQNDIFDRINVNVTTDTTLYIRINSFIRDEWPDGTFIEAAYSGDEIQFNVTDSIK